MKITISQSEFNKSLSNALRIVERNTTMPILKGVMLEVKDNKLYISATDLLISIKSNIAGLNNNFENGSIVVQSANILLEIIKRLPDGNVKLSTDMMNNLNVKCRYSEFNLNGLSSDEYPEWPEVDSIQSFNVEKNLLMDMISKTEFAISNDQARPVLTGSLLEVENDEIILVSLDGYRLAVRKSNIDNFEKNISMIIPGKAIRKLLDILKTIKDENQNIEIKSSENHIVINTGETIMVSRLLEGHFLSYRDIIRNEYNTKITINKNSFKLALERASYIDREGSNSLIKLKIEPDKVVIESNSDTGNINEFLLCEVEGEPMEIAFNTRYILEGVRVIDTENIDLYLVGDVHPCIINPENDPMYTYLILPVRLA